jgi:long-chain acyl-CoA synthetase
MRFGERASIQFPLYETDTFLTFLPMSHVYERVAGQCLPIYLGATIAYAKSLVSLANDILKVRPTVLLCVPRFLEAFRDKVEDTVAKAPPLRQKLFRLAMAQGVKKHGGPDIWCDGPSPCVWRCSRSPPCRR